MQYISLIYHTIFVSLKTFVHKTHKTKSIFQYYYFQIKIQGEKSPGHRAVAMGVYPIQNLKSQISTNEDVSHEYLVVCIRKEFETFYCFIQVVYLF